MVVQLANSNGEQIKRLKGIQFDFELNDGDRDFSFTVPYDKCGDFEIGQRVFIKNTEIGGVIGAVSTDTSDNTVTYSGYCWRGILSKKIITPPSGQPYKTVSGDLNTIISTLLSEHFNKTVGGVFVQSKLFKGSSELSGYTVTNFSFDRYCTLHDGICKMVSSVGCRIEIDYDEGQPNGNGICVVSALPIKDYTTDADYNQRMEFSSDDKLNFKLTEIKNGVNHLIIGGKGDLTQRTIIHKYVNQNGAISNTQYYFGDDEIVEFYENTSSDQLNTQAEDELKERMNSKSFDMDVETLGIDIAIGDIVGGRDFITGIYVKKPLKNIVVKIDGDTISKTYTLEGSD